jgi:NADH:ubiquinone oxidoreductase subunit K
MEAVSNTLVTILIIMEVVIVCSILILIPIQIMINQKRDKIFYLFSTIQKDKIINFS